MTTLGLDKYGFQARLRPALLSLFPVFITIAVWAPTLYKTAASLVGLAVACGLTVAFAHFARRRGRAVEQRLVEEWGGLPTTLWLRHGDHHLESGTKQRYYEFLEDNIPGWKSPTRQEEAEDQKHADSRYSSAVRWLLEYTRDTKQFHLVFTENISYGFRRNAHKTTLKQFKFKFDKQTKCLLFVEYDEKIITSEKRLKSIINGKIVKRLIKESAILRWWKFRDSSLHYSLKSIKKEKRMPHTIEDSAIPIENLPKLFVILDKINKKYKTKSITYGHIGNGNIHIRLISSRKKREIIKKIAIQFFDEVFKLDGTITAEHGDGLARSEFIKKQYGKKNYQIFKEIKNLFDPNNILNPGKIISNKSSIIENLQNF